MRFKDELRFSCMLVVIVYLYYFDMKKIFYVVIVGMAFSCWKEHSCKCEKIVDKKDILEFMNIFDDTTYVYHTVKGRKDNASAECAERNEVYVDNGDSVFVDCELD